MNNNLNIGSFFVSIGVLSGGILLLKGNPKIIRGYEKIKNNPEEVRKMIRSMRFVGVWLTLIGLLFVLGHISYFLHLIL